MKHIALVKAAAPTSGDKQIEINLAEMGVDDRRAVAQNPNASSEILANLARDEDWRVRLRVAKNPSTPTEVLGKMVARSKDENVLDALLLRPDFPAKEKLIAKFRGAEDEDQLKALQEFVDYNPNHRFCRKKFDCGQMLTLAGIAECLAEHGGDYGGPVYDWLYDEPAVIRAISKWLPEKDDEEEEGDVDEWEDDDED